MKFHLWECYNPQKISVDIKKKLKSKIRSAIKKDLYKIANKLKIPPARLYDYFVYQSAPIPLNTLLALSKTINIPLLEIEKSITLYKQMFVPIKNSVKNPKLPIEINPYLTSIIANLYFDGSVPKDGKGTYYNQKSDKIMNDFIKKVKYVFGDVFYSLNLDHRGILKCRIPRIIGEICKHIYNIKSFGTTDSRIPKVIFNLNKEHKQAFILTGIIDEGSIAYDGSIIFGVSNKRMIQDFELLCKNLDLKISKIKQKKNSNHYYIYINSISKFYDILKDLKKKYPIISLRHKEDRLVKALEIKNQKYLHTKNFLDKRKLLIISELGKKNCSINYLSNKFIISPRTLRRYMYQLMNEKKVLRIKNGGEFLYNLPKFI